MKNDAQKKPNERTLSVEFNLEHVKALLEASKQLANQGLISG